VPGDLGHPGAGHWDLEALAQFADGDVTDADSATMSAHLDRCEACTRRLGQIRTTRALLSALPPEPMPPAVADRVDAAIAAAGTAPLAATVVPNQPRRRWWRSPAVAGTAAAVAVVVLIGAIVTATVLRHQHRKSSASADSAAGGQASAAASAQTIKEWQTGTDYTAASIASLVPRLLTGTPAAAPTPAPQTPGPQTPGPQNLGLSPNSKAAPANPTPSAASNGALGTTATNPPPITFAQMQASRDAIVACGKMLNAGNDVTPLAIDFARFDGRPAVVLVLPTFGHPETVDVWVVRSVCSDAAIDLYFHRVARAG
jgi:hypothetical protein